MVVLEVVKALHRGGGEDRGGTAGESGTPVEVLMQVQGLLKQLQIVGVSQVRVVEKNGEVGR